MNPRRLLRKYIRRLGFRRKIAPDFVDVMLACGIEVVLDVGANDGAFGREIRDQGYKEKIISFEPSPVVYKRLERAIVSDPKWFASPIALGDVDGERELIIAKNDAMSSLKTLTEFGHQTGATPVGKQLIKIMRLDKYLASSPDLGRKIYLKIDTQGFELEVLQGAGDMLSQITAVQAEIALVHTYSNTPDWLSFLQWMREKGFEVATAICNSSLDAQVREFDFVFVKR